MIQEHGRRELVGRVRRSRVPNERSDVGRCGEMHDAEQNEEHPTSLKQSNTSRCRHDQTRMTKRITSGLTRKTCSCGSFEPDLNFVAIRIGHVSVREAGSELATTEQSPSGAFYSAMARSMSSGSTSRKPKCAMPPLRPAVVGSSTKVTMSCLPEA